MEGRKSGPSRPSCRYNNLASRRQSGNGHPGQYRVTVNTHEAGDPGQLCFQLFSMIRHKEADEHRGFKNWISFLGSFLPFGAGRAGAPRVGELSVFILQRCCEKCCVRNAAFSAEFARFLCEQELFGNFSLIAETDAGASL